MILVDTSAWVEFLRKTTSETHLALARHIESDTPIVTTEPVAMELLAGARDELHAVRLRVLMFSFRFEPLETFTDFERAAQIYRSCKEHGQQVRSTSDCLIAAVAMRLDIPILHSDRDFTTIAKFTPLQIAV